MKRTSHYKDRRRKEAEERNKVRAKRNPQEQLARLDKMLGEGKGAVKERKRLKEQIEIIERVKKSIKKEDK